MNQEIKMEISTTEAPKKQKYLKDRGLIILIAYLSAFVPLTTDLYLPSLPSMTKSLNSTTALINLTIILFFVFYAIGTLFWGPLSDKYGRKRVLLAGLAIYTLASICCAILSDNVYKLILFRIIQAIGAGAVIAVGTAIIKDVYTGRKRASVLAVVQSMIMIAPIVAPVIGAFVLKFTSWRGVFWVLSIAGLIGIIGGIAFEETINLRNTGSIFESMAHLAVVARNPGFSSLLVTFQLYSIPFMSYITASSYIYVKGFGLSEQVYSYFFSFNSLFLVLGPLLYIRLSRRFNSNSIITICFCIISMSGLLLSTIGTLKPWLFALSLLPATLSVGVMRPPCTNLMLEQQKENIGTASSLMGFSNTVFGCIGMTLISFDWPNRIVVIGVMYLLTALPSLAAWLMLSKKPFIRQVN